MIEEALSGTWSVIHAERQDGNINECISPNIITIEDRQFIKIPEIQIECAVLGYKGFFPDNSYKVMATDSIAQIILSKGAYFMSDTCDLKFVADDNTRLLYMYVKSKNGYFVASKGLTDYNKEFTRMMKAVKASNGKHRKLNEQWQINWGARDQK